MIKRPKNYKAIKSIMNKLKDEHEDVKYIMKNTKCGGGQ